MVAEGFWGKESTEIKVKGLSEVNFGVTDLSDTTDRVIVSSVCVCIKTYWYTLNMCNILHVDYTSVNL